MEKKITIKLFEDFKNDISISYNNSIALIQYVIDNRSSFEEIKKNHYKFNDYSIFIEVGMENENDWFEYSVQIDNDTDEYQEIFSVDSKVRNNGGQEISSQQYMSAAEYNDDDYELDLQNVFYSILYAPENADQDIDMLDITNVKDITNYADKILQLFISNI